MSTSEFDLSTPEALMRCFAARLNVADVEGLVSLYVPSAVFEPQPGVVVRGQVAIRDALGELVALQPTITTDIVEVLVTDDTALVINQWQLTGVAADGTPVEQAGRSTDVVRRQPDGRWLVVIDKP